MKYRRPLMLISVSLLLFLSGCDVVVGIFEAGFWTAIILVVLIVSAIAYGYLKLRDRD